MSDLIDGFNADFEGLERNIKCLGIRSNQMLYVYRFLEQARFELIDSITKHCGHDV